MKYRRLANTGVYVSELCLGAMTFGGQWPVIGALGQPEADQLVHRSLDAGVNFLDTANVYSLGDSEQILGKALGSKRHDVILATKVRTRMGPGPNQVGLSRLSILQEVEASLTRLGTDYSDLYQIHNVDPETPIEETLAALTNLVRAGKVRYIGCSNLDGVAAHAGARGLQTARARGVQDHAILPTPSSGRDLEREMISLLNDQQIGLLVWSPLAGGFLTGKFTRDGTSDAGRDVPRSTSHRSTRNVRTTSST